MADRRQRFKNRKEKMKRKIIRFNERKIKRFHYLENEKSFLDETKSIFHNFLRALITSLLSFSGKKKRMQGLT